MVLQYAHVAHVATCYMVWTRQCVLCYSGNMRAALFYVQAHARLAQRVRRLAEAEKDLVTHRGGTMVTLQYVRGTNMWDDKCMGTGYMSYPNYGGSDKPLQYVDVRLLAAAAEDEGVDLRLVYLSRSALDIVVSTTRHETYHRG